MVVNDDNSFMIHEQISVDFLEFSHGIYRNIPLEGAAVSQVDHKKVTQNGRMRIDNVKVADTEFETYTENDSAGNKNFIIKFGLSDIWSEKFDPLVSQPSSWYRGYYGNDLFQTMYLMRSLDRLDFAARRSFAVSPESGGIGNNNHFGGGGFSSGGGFSGGGFGGGGGGRW
jgi:uncharacterized membrane protein YgcG